MRKVTKKRNSSSTNLNKNLVSLQNLAGRVAALEEIVQQLVTWTKVELLCKDDNVKLDDDDKEDVGVKLPSGGRKMATTVKNLTIPSKLDVVTSSSSSRSLQSSGGRSAISDKRAAVAKKSTGGVPKHRIKPVSAPPIQEQREIFHQLFCDGGDNNENMEEEQEIQIKAEPVIVDDDVEFGGGGCDGMGWESSDENQQDNYHDQFVEEEEEVEAKQINVPCLRKRTRKGRDFYINGNDTELENEILHTLEEEAGDDYHPGSEPEEDPDSESSDCLITTSSKKKQRTRRPPKKKKTIVNPSLIIIPSSEPQAILPNPYISLGPAVVATLTKVPTPAQRTKRNKKPKTRKPSKMNRRPTKKSGFRFKCESCTYGTNFRRKYLQHVRKHTGERPYLCASCGKGFRGADLLAHHMKYMHNEDKPLPSSNPCPVEGCGQEFRSKPILRGHINKCHKDPRRQCDICKGIFANALMLRHHKIRMHENRRAFSCPICGHGFSFDRHLKTHVARHSDPNYKMRGNKPHPLPENKGIEIDPERMYALVPKFYCEVEGCGKSFVTETMLRGHVTRRHMTEEDKKVSCDICGKVFKNKNRLQWHVGLVHTDKRPHICCICGQAFKTKTHLVRHERGHENPNWKPRSNSKPKKFNRDKTEEEQNEGLPTLTTPVIEEDQQMIERDPDNLQVVIIPLPKFLY